ncbi:MAG: hypothetical protein ABIH00_05130 [Armatimonadota bacterium]
MPYKIEVFKEFIEKIKDSPRVVILAHASCDGLCAGVILQKALKKTGISSEIIYPGKGEDIAYYSDTISGTSLKDKIKSLNPGALFVLDLGFNENLAKDNIPVLFIDHHYADAARDNKKNISSYFDKNIRPTSLLVYDLCSSISDVKDLGYLAAAGTISDLGRDNPFSIISHIIDENSLKSMQEIGILVNSARRSSSYDIAAALKLLTEAGSADDIIRGKLPEAYLLQQYREEVNNECKRIRHTAPVFKWRVALIPFESRSDIGGLIASMWAHKLQSYVVIAVNFGYIEGMAEFTVKTNTKINAIKFIDSVKPKDIRDKIVSGHAASCAGIVDMNLWRKIARNMGYD